MAAAGTRGTGNLSTALDEFLLRGELTIRNNSHSLLMTDHSLALLARWRGAVLTNNRTVALECKAALSECPDEIRFREVIVALSGVATVDPIRILEAAARVEIGGNLHVVAENRRGAERVLTWCAPLVGFSSPQQATRSHCRLVSLTREIASSAKPLEPSFDWIPVDGTEGLTSLPGVFSADQLDGGTRCLLDFFDHMSAQLTPTPATVLDLGCGYGALGIVALKRFPKAKLHLVDVDARAVRSTQHNLTQLSKATIARADAFWLDVTVEPLPQLRYDLILLNPPFHAAGTEQRELGATIVKIAARSLGRRGVLLMVANNHLRYAALLEKLKDCSVEQREAKDGFDLFMVRKLD